MAIVTAATGLVTSWGDGSGSPVPTNTHMVGSTNSNPATVTLNINAPEADVTAFAASLNSRSYIPTLYDWTVNIHCQMKPATLGSAGLISFSGTGFIPNDGGTPKLGLNVGGYTIEGNYYVSPPVTAQAASAPVCQSYVPGIFDWKATVKAWLDGTIPLVLPGLTPAAIALKIAEDGATDPGFSGTGMAVSVGAPVKVGEVTEISYGLRGTGDLSVQAGASTWAAWWFSSTTTPAAITVPNAGTLLWQASTGRTFSGSAFMTGWKVNCMLDEPVTLDITARGTGALTTA